MVKRPPIPRELAFDVRYASAQACAVCQKPNIQLHHIDGDPTNNVASNLVALCQEHHGEAHTQRGLTSNFSQERVRAVKLKWETEVRSRREKTIITGNPISQKETADHILWPCINIERLTQLCRIHGLKLNTYPEGYHLYDRGFIDEYGLPYSDALFPESKNFLSNSIFERLPFPEGHRLNYCYANAISDLIKCRSVGYVTTKGLTRTALKRLAQPGSLIFVSRGFRFRDHQKESNYAIREVYTFRNNIRLTFFVDTRWMLGTSAKCVTFSGHARIGALLLIKDIRKESKELIINATPVALGIHALEPV